MLTFLRSEVRTSPGEGELVGKDRDGRCVVNVSLPWTPSMSDVMATGIQ